MTWDWTDGDARSHVAISCSKCGTKRTIPIADLHEIRKADALLGERHRDAARRITG